MVQFTWNGDKVRRRVIKAVERGVNVVMAAAVLEAKMNHPGWKNVFLIAEGSVRILKFAKGSRNVVSGEWGSAGGPKPVPGQKPKAPSYVLWLEVNHGSFLRNAADKEYPKLTAAIRDSLFRSAVGG